MHVTTALSMGLNNFGLRGIVAGNVVVDEVEGRKVVEVGKRRNIGNVSTVEVQVVEPGEFRKRCDVIYIIPSK